MDGRFNICKVNNGFELNEDRGTNGNLETGTITSPLDVEYVGNRKRSLAQLTREALPRLDNYRISKRALKRPSLGELHGEIHEKVICLAFNGRIFLFILYVHITCTHICIFRVKLIHRNKYTYLYLHT